jgi:hypothetical protein
MDQILIFNEFLCFNLRITIRVIEIIQALNTICQIANIHP